jgi:hypothetical protein
LVRWALLASALSVVGGSVLADVMSRLGQLASAAKMMISKDATIADAKSVDGVLKLVIEGKRPGGRSLEANKPLSPGEAQANLDKAMRDPLAKGRIEEMRHQVSDPQLRLLFEAAILDEEGFYGARDLKIGELEQAVR